MVIKSVYDKLEDIPKTVDDFPAMFTEKNGKFELTGIPGIQTQDAITRQENALKKEREEHKATKARLAEWGELKHDDVQRQLDRVAELEEASKGKLDEAKLDEMANRRAEAIAKSRTAPTERELAKIKREHAEASERLKVYEARETRRKVHDEVRGALGELKVLPEAYEDALNLSERHMEVGEDGRAVTREGAGVTAGLDAKGWLGEVLEKRTHWLPPNVGGGAKGGGGPVGGGSNPWSHEGWNMTEQHRIIAAKGQDYAQRMARAAGTEVGKGRPQPKKR